MLRIPQHSVPGTTASTTQSDCSETVRPLWAMTSQLVVSVQLVSNSYGTQTLLPHYLLTMVTSRDEVFFA